MTLGHFGRKLFGVSIGWILRFAWRCGVPGCKNAVLRGETVNEKLPFKWGFVAGLFLVYLYILVYKMRVWGCAGLPVVWRLVMGAWRGENRAACLREADFFMKVL